jgi:GTP 3',8-cyclase
MSLPASGDTLRTGRRTVTPVTDRFSRPVADLRVSVTDRCNFRCAYCLPAEEASPTYLNRSALLDFNGIARVAASCARLGVTKIRLTGGEPLLRRGLPRLVASLRVIDGVDDLALTTNGWLLAAQAADLAAAGLDRVTVSLDCLDDTMFRQVNGVGAGIRPVLDGIRAAQDVGLDPVKLNAVIRRGVNESAVLPLARFARAEGLQLRLIEYMDVGQSHRWRLADVVPAEEIVATVAAAFPLEPVPATPGAVARRFRYRDGAGELGVISAVSRPFCADCTRIRLTADGKLYTCLFAAHGDDLRPVLARDATDRELQDLIAAVWRRRTDRSSLLRSQGLPGHGSVEMHRIGG